MGSVDVGRHEGRRQVSRHERLAGKHENGWQIEEARTSMWWSNGSGMQRRNFNRPLDWAEHDYFDYLRVMSPYETVSRHRCSSSLIESVIVFCRRTNQCDNIVREDGDENEAANEN